jgi:putative methionine-R-sulfoxide reductase with GAF domain
MPTHEPGVTEPFDPAWTRDDMLGLVSSRGNPSETLSNVVHFIHRQFATDVCSAYLLEPDRANLVLAATIGLRPESVGRVRMRVTEGLVGLVAEHARPVVVNDTKTHPRFKYFRDAGEDPYRTFLGVPVMDRGVLQGVLVVQTREARPFAQEDVRRPPRRRGTGADRHRGARGRPVRGRGARAARRDLSEPGMELGRRERRALPGPRPGRLAGVRSQSTRPAAARLRRPD